MCLPLCSAKLACPFYPNPRAEVLTARILAVRSTAPTRRLQDTTASSVVVDASLTIDTPQNDQLSQNGATTVVDDLLQVRGHAGQGGRV